MITRRKFIQNSALLGGAMMLSSCATKKVKGANGKLNVALIGVGGVGIQAIDNLGKAGDVNIVAGCDVDDFRAANNYKKLDELYGKTLPRFRDYRVMLDKMDGDIDGVVVSTPDHMHYPISLWAMSMEKHVFCQKPLARTIWEMREMKRIAAKEGVITQMGNQGHTTSGWRTIREWYEAGLLGQIEDIYVWTDRPAAFWKQGINVTKPAGEPVPATLDYDLWLGVAQYQPYNHSFVPHDWRGLRAYGTGAMGDMGCHFLDVPYSAFELNFPKKVKASSTPFNDYSWPSEASIGLEFENKRGVNNKIRLHWFDGYRKPKNVKRVDQPFIDDPKNKNCTIIVGTKETIITNEYGNFVYVYPRARMVEMKKANSFPAETIARSITPMNAHLEWAKHCLLGKNPPANFDYAAPFTEMAMLGMIAITQPERELEYNAETMSFKDCPQADRLIRSLYDYRKEFLP